MKASGMYIFLLAAGLLFTSCARQESSKPASENATGQDSASHSAEDVLVSQLRPYQEKSLPNDIYGRDDPFAPFVVKPDAKLDKEKSGLILEGIIIDAQQSLAMINDRIVKQGDMIDNKEVVEIDDQSVTLKDEYGLEYVLKLF